MRFRKLRIAWSVFWGVACVLLIALWVRSYWKCDVMFGDEGNYGITFFGSDGGTVYVVKDFSLGLLPGIGRNRTEFTSGEALKNLASFQWTTGPRTLIRIPYWLPILITVSFAAAPWIRLRFSLRTLLIATTLVAVALGLIVWLR